MLTGALLILAPLFLGFTFALSNRRLMTVIHYLVEGLVYFILVLLGLGLGQMEGLLTHLGTMAYQVSGLVLAMLVANLAALWLFHYFLPLDIGPTEESAKPSYRRLFMAGLKPLLAVVVGGFLGYLWFSGLPMVEDVATWALMLLLFLIGLQLRNAGLSLRKLLMNRQGLGIALTMGASSLIAGLALTPWLGVSWNQALAIASGFGWYSLSGIMIGDAMGPAWGGVAFLNDVLREIIALALIPVVIGARPAMAIGYGGATSMDFTLPVIRSSGGLACVPVAIASGFLLSFLSPVLMGVFLSLG
ncbi:MAG: lysine exporter LysO family protein [Marinobacter sp.]|uniref:lysine exporter LysO family protein n=1 Tax=Marinobacter sp. TaxID=50741 RepID=UPI002B265E5B|nr:lysine exporter LysO family protein [Marinobacter sp.]